MCLKPVCKKEKKTHWCRCSLFLSKIPATYPVKQCFDNMSYFTFLLQSSSLYKNEMISGFTWKESLYTKCTEILGNCEYSCLCFKGFGCCFNVGEHSVYVTVLTCVGVGLHVFMLLHAYLCTWVHLSVCRNIQHHLRCVWSIFSRELEINHLNPCWHQNPWSTNKRWSQTNANRQRDGHYVGFNHHHWCLTLCVFNRYLSCRGRR